LKKNAAFHKKGSIEQGKGIEREEGREKEIKEGNNVTEKATF